MPYSTYRGFYGTNLLIIRIHLFEDSIFNRAFRQVLLFIRCVNVELPVKLYNNYFVSIITWISLFLYFIIRSF